MAGTNGSWSDDNYYLLKIGPKYSTSELKVKIGSTNEKGVQWMVAAVARGS
jgi:hypothetical protein